jgi:Membrane bound O-acyl transferase family
MLKVGESRPGVLKGKESANDPVSPSGHPFIAPWLYDTVELMHTMRGLKWKFGQGMHIPKETKPRDRLPFIRATFMSFLQNFLLLDLLESTIKLFPGVGSPVGGSMFYTNLPPIWRYSVSTFIHMMTGTCLILGFRMVYDLITLLAVSLLNNSPASWPPILDNPWTADSMHIFWSKRWHQLLRQTFLVLGGYPGKWIAGDLGLLLGTFIASGLFHEFAIHSMERGFDPTVLAFFASQGPILILERMWKALTGRRVGGLMGRLWVYSILFIGAQPMSMSSLCNSRNLYCSHAPLHSQYMASSWTRWRIGYTTSPESCATFPDTLCPANVAWLLSLKPRSSI